MNNVKRIIAAGLVGTAVISTGVVASAETYKEAAIKALTDAGVPANYAADVADACGKITLTDAQAKTVNEKIAYALQAINGKSKEELAAKDSPVVKDLQAKVQKPLERQLNISIVADQGTGLAIYKADPTTGEALEGNDNMLLSWTIDDLKAINAKADKNKLQQSSTIDTVMDYAKQSDKTASKTDQNQQPSNPNQDNKPATGTQDNNDSENKKPADQNKVEELKNKVDAVEPDANYSEADKANLNKAKQALKDFMDKSEFTIDEYNAIKALINSLPDGPAKDALLALLAEDVKDATNETGKPFVDPEVAATQTPADSDSETTSGTTAKTATNFGNVALAGAGLMTVAGAVFVISKKKIC